jgi:hypothetical protein
MRQKRQGGTDLPIRKELRRFYGREWQKVIRPRILSRAGGRFKRDGTYLGGASCECCGRPDRTSVFTVRKRNAAGAPVMFWLPVEGGEKWRDHFGLPIDVFKVKGFPPKVYVMLQVGHLNHTPGDDRQENLKAWCGWCHLHFDASHHHETRAIRKDLERPLLRELQFPSPKLGDFPNRLEHCLAMQRWSINDGDGPQRLISVNDWLAEEILLRMAASE